MQIRFTYEKNQVIQALRLHFIGRNEVRILIILVNVFAVLAAILFYFQMVSPLAFLLSSLLWIFLMISFWFILPNSVYKKTNTFKDAFKMILNNEGIILENPRGQVEWEWSKFSRMVESPSFFHLYFDSKSFFLLPKNTLEEPISISDLRNLLQTKIAE
jgi:hypothetical protein